MRERSLPEALDRHLGHVRTLAVLVACLTLFTGHALAQAKSPGPAGAEVTSKGEAAGGAASEVAVEPVPANTGSDNQEPATPRPKWACDQQTVTAEPVWRGERSLTFAFNIRNEGTADLNIKASGG